MTCPHGVPLAATWCCQCETSSVIPTGEIQNKGETRLQREATDGPCKSRNVELISHGPGRHPALFLDEVGR